MHHGFHLSFIYFIYLSIVIIYFPPECIICVSLIAWRSASSCLGPVAEQAGSSDTKKGADALGEREHERERERARERERERETGITRNDTPWVTFLIPDGKLCVCLCVYTSLDLMRGECLLISLFLFLKYCYIIVFIFEILYYYYLFFRRVYCRQMTPHRVI